jgi:hypothetical protein
VYSDPQYPLGWLVSLWQSILFGARNVKREQFQNDADEAMRFYGGRHDFVYTRDLSPWLPAPSFTMTVNRVADVVSRFGPLLYHANPNRRATPREIVAIPPGLWPSPQVFQAVASGEQVRQELDRLKGAVMESYLNWTPLVTDLRAHSRSAIDEALIKGRGVLMTALYQPPGTPFKVAGSFFETVDNLLIDPDSESLHHATWTAIWCCHPTWQVEREYGLRPGTLRGNYESYAQQAQVDAQGAGTAGYVRQQGLSNDQLGYWKVFSRMGLGSRIKGSRGVAGHPLDVFGDNVFLVIAPGVPYPLNLPPEVTRMPGATADPHVFGDLYRRVSWPIPTWVSGQWPFSVLDFRPIPRRVWPMSPVQPGLGELKMIDWIYTFLSTRIKKSYRSYLCVTADMDQNVTSQLINGQDLEIIKVPPRAGSNINELVSKFEFPEVKGEIVEVLRILQEQFNERVGLNELDTGRQLRSAAEADYRVAHMQLRSDDWAEIVEDWQSQAARKEAFAARYHLGPQDVAPALGEAAAYFFAQFLKSPDVARIATDLEYRIESGSVRKPNRDREIRTVTDLMQSAAPVLSQVGFGMGNWGPWNSLIERWCRARGESPAGLLVTAPPLPPPPPPGMGPTGGGVPVPSRNGIAR